MKRIYSGAFMLGALVNMAPPQVLTIGDFESFAGTLAASGAIVVAGQTAITGWTPALQKAILRNGSILNVPASSGSNFIDLTCGSALGVGAGFGIEEMVTGLAAGAPYRVAFDLGISNL